ncbi:MAG: hypothetical protein QW076_03385 [Candidatus Anstonellales archaeon]
MADLILIIFGISLASLIFSILIYYELRKLLLHFGLLKKQELKRHEKDNANETEKQKKSKNKDEKVVNKEKPKTIFDDD